MSGAEITAILGLSLLSVLSTAVGFGLATWLGDRGDGVAIGIGFSVGMMLLLALVELLPEAARAGSWWAAAVAAGVGAALVAGLHLVVPHTHLVREHGVADAPGHHLAPRRHRTRAARPPGGFALATSYPAAPRVGLVTALAIALHNVPEQFVMGLPATLTKDRRLLWTMAVLAASAEPVGALVGLLAVGLVPDADAALLAFAAGAMAYVALHELVPLARRYGRRSRFAAPHAPTDDQYAELTAVV
ncbi:MAG: ZIP family metal transporter [Acidimicrobiales bacterium]